MQHQSKEMSFEEFAKDVELILGLISWRLTITPPRGKNYKSWLKNGLPRRWTLTVRIRRSIGVAGAESKTETVSFTSHSMDVYSLIPRVCGMIQKNSTNYHEAFAYDPAGDY